MKILKAYYLYFFVIALVIAFCIYQIVPKAQAVHQNIARIEEMEAKVNDLNVKYLEVQKRQNIENMKYANLEQKIIYQPQYAYSNSLLALNGMLEDITNKALKNQLKLRKIDYIKNLTNDVITTNDPNSYNACGVKLSLIGSYLEFQKFLNEIFTYPYLVNLNTIDITPYQRDKRVLIIDVTLHMYAKK